MIINQTQRINKIESKQKRIENEGICKLTKN